jgi:hypothetical protein
LIALVEQIIPDPFSDFTGNRNISTLGLTLRKNFSHWIFIEDYRSRSVLAGLSVIGGLGSFLSTTLVMLVGTSLITAVNRMSSLS